MPLDRADGDLKVVLLDAFDQLMRQKEANTVENSAGPDRRSSSSKHYNQRKSAISSVIKFYPEAGALFLRETVQFKKSYGLELIKALSLVLSDKSCSLMV